MRPRLRLTVSNAVGITGRLLWLWNAEQLPHSRDVVGAPAIGEEPVVTDAVSAAKQFAEIRNGSKSERHP